MKMDQIYNYKLDIIVTAQEHKVNVLKATAIYKILIYVLTCLVFISHCFRACKLLDYSKPQMHGLLRSLLVLYIGNHTSEHTFDGSD